MKFPQLDPAKRRKIIYVAVGLFVFNFLFFDILPLFKRKPDWSEVAAAITQASQATLPRKMDGSTLVEIRPGDPWELTWRYVISDEVIEDINDPEVRPVFENLLRRQVETSYRESKTNSMTMIRDLGITCIHRWEDKDGKLVTEIRTGPKVLSKR